MTQPFLNNMGPSGGGAAQTGPRDALSDIELERAAWRKERERLLVMLAQQQRLAHTGLITAGLVHEVANYSMLISGDAYMASRSSDPTVWRDALKEVPSRCEEISETIRTVLAFAGRQEESELESFRVSEVLREAARLVRPLAASEDISLVHQVEQDAVLMGEQRLLVQALVNLGTNAVTACDGGPGNVAMRASIVDGSTCRVEVQDDGLGIPEYLRPRLWRPFVTGRAAKGGNGLGLFLVRQTIRRLGGVIRVITSPAGTTIRFDIPATVPG